MSNLLEELQDMKEIMSCIENEYNAVVRKQAQLVEEYNRKLAEFDKKKEVYLESVGYYTIEQPKNLEGW